MIMTYEKVTGKKLLAEAATLVRDLSVFVIDLGKRAYVSIKTALTSEKSDNRNQAESVG